jgi:hypothetical protein
MPPSIATHRPLHPLNIIAAVAVVLFCGAGVAGIMGWLPNSTGTAAKIIDSPKLSMSKQIVARAPSTVAPVKLEPVTGWCKHCGNIESTRSLDSGSTEVRVRLDDGTLRVYHQPNPQWRTGDRVNIVSGTLVASN